MSGNATRRSGAVLVLLLLLGALPCPAGAVPARVARKSKAARPAAADTSRVLFHVGDQVVTTEDVRQRLEEIPEAARATFTTPEGRQQLLDRIVEERVWLLSAVRSGVPDRPQVKQQLAQSRRDLLIRTYLNEVMAGNPAPTDSEVSAYYAAHGSDYRTPASVTLRHIQTATESQARQVLKLAREIRSLPARRWRALRP